MELLISIIGFLGAWLLVLGPVYQASLELHEQDREIDRVRKAGKKIAAKKKVSVWWWLLPPVKVYLQRKHNNEYIRRYFYALDHSDVSMLAKYINKATGWLFVAWGALFIAYEATYSLYDHLGIPMYIFWISVLIFPYLCIGYTIAREKKTVQVVAIVKQRTRNKLKSSASTDTKL